LLSHEQVDQKLWSTLSGAADVHPERGILGSIAEAFAHELPVVTNPLVGDTEIVDEECGVLIEPQIPTPSSLPLLPLHDDPERWLRMKAAAGAGHGSSTMPFWARRIRVHLRSLVRH